MLAIPPWILLRLVTYNSIRQKVLLCALLALIGLALACVFPPLMAEITYVVEAKEKAYPGRYGSNGAYAQAYGTVCYCVCGRDIDRTSLGGVCKGCCGVGHDDLDIGVVLFRGCGSVLDMDGWVYYREKC